MRRRFLSASEIFALIVLSGALGLAFGCVAGLAMGSNQELAAAIVVGGNIGIVTSGVLVLAMSRGSRLEGLLLIGLPTLVVAWVSGFAGPMVSTVISTMVYVGLCLAWAVWTRLGVKQFPRWACERCGYDLRGLRAEARCPECGADRQNSILKAIRLKRRSGDGSALGRTPEDRSREDRT